MVIQFTLIALPLIVLGILYLWMKKESQLERVVLVTIDTLRADHLGSYGYISNVSPFIDSVAKQGILFKNAFAPMSHTAPSHTSLFTSLYPLEHGVLKNWYKLADSYLTMAEIFQDMGYKTAGVVSTDRHFGPANLHQGFQYFNEPMDLVNDKITETTFRELRKKNLQKSILENLRDLQNKTFTDKRDFLQAVKERIDHAPWIGFPQFMVEHAKFDLRYRTASETIDVALNWLDDVEPTEKFFLWIHLFDPHTPLRPSKFHFNKVTDLSDDEKLFTFLLKQQEVAFEYFGYDKMKMLSEIRSYDSEILYVDAELQRFFQHYQLKGFDTKSLWVITADHGEGLGNHKWWRHGKHIYNEQLRVPLLFRFSSGTSKGTVIDHVIENVDIFPTIFEIIGGDTKQYTKISGESLTPFMLPKMERKYRKKYAFSQRRVYDSKITIQNPDREEGEKYALQTQDSKYIFFTHGSDEFFDLRNDPYETFNLINDVSETQQQLKDSLFAKIEKLKESTPHALLTVDDETIKLLKSLGYIR